MRLSSKGRGRRGRSCNRCAADRSPSVQAWSPQLPYSFRYLVGTDGTRRRNPLGDDETTGREGRRRAACLLDGRLNADRGCNGRVYNDR
ncbi:hypothetical protein L596_004432 [Steinernema carpocapsae]|uniref:Uncharacterized protein n=1 Tax=Steinernema carpocapsae TaxID=34508 RepID=A0A4U8UXE8_STECR|nr:hypothetical protein L596_004432 [Steinernema carpocapsae]